MNASVDENIHVIAGFRMYAAAMLAWHAEPASLAAHLDAPFLADPSRVDAMREWTIRWAEISERDEDVDYESMAVDARNAFPQEADRSRRGWIDWVETDFAVTASDDPTTFGWSIIWSRLSAHLRVSHIKISRRLDAELAGIEPYALFEKDIGPLADDVAVLLHPAIPSVCQVLSADNDWEEGREFVRAACRINLRAAYFRKRLRSFARSTDGSELRVLHSALRQVCKASGAPTWFPDVASAFDHELSKSLFGPKAIVRE